MLSEFSKGICNEDLKYGLAGVRVLMFPVCTPYAARMHLSDLLMGKDDRVKLGEKVLTRNILPRL
jgi:hypothetical protein